MSQTPDMPFSPHLLELYQEFRSAPKDQKGELARQIAEAFASERDVYEYQASEQYHEFFETFEQARQKYDQQSQRLTRVAATLIEEYLAPGSFQDSPATPRPRADN